MLQIQVVTNSISLHKKSSRVDMVVVSFLKEAIGTQRASCSRSVVACFEAGAVSPRNLWKAARV